VIPHRCLPKHLVFDLAPNRELIAARCRSCGLRTPWMASKQAATRAWDSLRDHADALNALGEVDQVGMGAEWLSAAAKMDSDAMSMWHMGDDPRPNIPASTEVGVFVVKGWKAVYNIREHAIRTGLLTAGKPIAAAAADRVTASTQEEAVPRDDAGFVVREKILSSGGISRALPGAAWGIYDPLDPPISSPPRHIVELQARALFRLAWRRQDLQFEEHGLAVDGQLVDIVLQEMGVHPDSRVRVGQVQVARERAALSFEPVETPAAGSARGALVMQLSHSKNALLVGHTDWADRNRPIFGPPVRAPRWCPVSIACEGALSQARSHMRR